ncbi:MAG: DNA-processing protein DprA [Clostridia bacterium]|nr:DNA-processing protein DprA [Clostridia bacterium]
MAVLGSGFNHIYPEENEWVFHKILLNCGCIISEYPPNVEPNTKNFPKRNRIISGIASSILVVEAEYRSGSTITAKYAKEQSKKVYAIPSNIDSSQGIGTNKLIRDGAILITKPSQIKKDFLKKSIQKEEQGTHLNLELKIPEEYISIYKILEKGPMHINEIAKIEKKSMQELNSVMTMMEIEGYITRLDYNLYKRKE